MVTNGTSRLFAPQHLPDALARYLASTNPWWQDGRVPDPLPYRRWAFPLLLKRLTSGLAPGVVLRGPRQVGKSTLQAQLVQELIAGRGVRPTHVLHAQFDDIPSLRGLGDPLLAIVRWFQDHVLRGNLHEVAGSTGQPVCILLDEAQNVRDWAPQLKSILDTWPVRVMLTGSSALRIAVGQDSLAGRVSTVELGPLLLREIAGLRLGEDLHPLLPDNGLEPLLHREFWRELADAGGRRRHVRDEAFAAFAERGGYPRAQVAADVGWPEVADQLNEDVIRRAISHDLRLGPRGRRRDEGLLQALFRLACRYAGQAPARPLYTQELQRALQAGVPWQRILTYLHFLDDCLLVRLVPPLEARLRRTQAPPKLCLADHALRAAYLQEQVPLTAEGLQLAPHLRDLAGHLAESVVGSFLIGIPGLEVAYLPARPEQPEVDFVLTIGYRRIPVEVKYRHRVDGEADTAGLRAFLDQPHFEAPFGLLVTLTDDVEVRDPRIVPVSLPSLLLMR